MKKTVYVISILLVLAFTYSTQATISSAPIYPEMASNPMPPNGAVNVSVEADLGWTAGVCGAVNFSQLIHMSTDPDALWSGFLPYYARCGGHTVFMFIILEQMRKRIAS